MKIETRLDFKSYVKLMYVLSYRKRSMIYITIIGLGAFFLPILYFLGVNIPFEKSPLLALVFGFVIIVVMPIAIYFNARKTFSTHGLIKERIIYEITDDKICQTGETFHSEMDWTKIYKIVEMKNWILIYHNRQIANTIPKESFGENLMEFRNLVRSKKIKAKLK